MPDGPQFSRSDPGVFFSRPHYGEGPLPNDGPQPIQRRLDEIIGAAGDSTEAVRALLRLGAERLGVEQGYLAEIDPGAATHTVLVTSGPHPNIERGDTVELATTYCRALLARGQSLAVRNAPEQGWAGDPAYDRYGLSTYLGTRVVTDGTLHGTLCFGDRAPRAEPIDDADRAVLSMMGRAVERVLASREAPAPDAQSRALQRERQHFQSLVAEVEGYALFRLDAKGRVRSWNEGAEQIQGYSRADILGAPLSRFYPEEARAAGVPEQHLARAREEESVQVEGWRVRKDGSRFWATVTLLALRDEEGALRGFTTLMRDLSDRRRRERRYEAIFNQTYQFIGLMDPDGTLIEANDTALEFGGLDREDVVGKPFWETYWWQVDDETQQQLRDAIARAAEGEFVRYDVEVQGGDENIVIDFSIRPVVNEEGDVTLLIPEGRNITELKSLKERERQLEETRNLLAQAEELADVGGWRVSVEGDPPYHPTCTDTLHDLFGRSPDASPTLGALLDSFSAAGHEDGAAAIERALETGEGWDLEAKIVAEDGTERWLRSIGEPVMDDGAVVALYGAFEDITAQKQRQRQLEEQNERLDQFASLVSHDLRNPLHVAKNRLALARAHEDLSHLPPAEGAVERMEAIIEDLLTLTWGGQELDAAALEPLRLAHVAEESWAVVDTTEATLRVYDDLELRADKGRLRRLLENLYRNAVEHAGDDVTVTLGRHPSGFYVADDGPGIPKEKRDRVCESGYSSREEGTGLGLSIVQTIAEAHGWTLRITESAEGGARFDIVTAPHG